MGAARRARTASGRSAAACASSPAATAASDALLIDLALAVTEAVTNSVVHAFIDREPGIVRAHIQAAPDELVVVVTDNGRGMQPRADSPGARARACRRSPR